MRISDWSSDVCSSDLLGPILGIDHIVDAVIAMDDAGARLFGQGRGQPGDQLFHLVHRLGFGEAVLFCPAVDLPAEIIAGLAERSEEHTSELQSLMRNSYAVFCLKKKKKHYSKIINT